MGETRINICVRKAAHRLTLGFFTAKHRVHCIGYIRVSYWSRKPHTPRRRIDPANENDLMLLQHVISCKFAYPVFNRFCVPALN